MKKDRGYTETALEKQSGVWAVSWKDNSAVTVLSNKYGNESHRKVKRRMKGKIEEIEMPDVIRKYNEGMLGVDLSDWKVEKYRISIRSKKWYFCAFTHCLDVIMVNASEL